LLTRSATKGSAQTGALLYDPGYLLVTHE